MNPFGILNQQPNPWDDPMKMDPSRVPLGLLSQGFMQPQMAQQDLPAPGAQPAGPAAMPPIQLPGATPPTPEGAVMPTGLLDQPKPEPGFLERLGTVAGGLYGQGGPGDALITLGAGLASRDGWGKGLMQANAQMQQQQLLRQKTQGQNETAKLLATRMKIPYEQAMGLIQSPAGASLLQQAFTSPEQFKTEKDAEGNLVQVNTKTGQRQILKAAEETFRPVTDPQERSRLGISPTDKTPYKVDSRGNFSAVGSPSTTINTAPGPAKSVYDSVEKRTEDARTAASSMPSFMEAKRLVDSGNITLGAGADSRVAMQKVGALFGIDSTAASNAETFRSAFAPIVLSTVKGLGAGSGISNADREFAEKAAGGNINLEPASIKRLIEIGVKAAEAKVKSHNSLIDQVYPDSDENRQVRSLFRVEAPAYEPPAPPTGGPKAVRNEAEFKMLKSGDLFTAPDGTIRRKP